MAVNKVEFGGETLIDLTSDSITPETMFVGKTAHNSAGEQIEGTFNPDIYQTKEDESLATNAKEVVNAINEVFGKVLTDAQVEKFGKLSAWYDENHYVNMTGSFTATDSGGTYEIGGTIKSTFTWSFSKLPTSLSVGGKSETPTQTGSTAEQTFTRTSQGSQTFTISGTYAGTYGNETVSKTWTYNFQNRRYWGMAEAPTTLDGTFIKGLTNKEFTTSRSKTFNLNDSTKTKYIWYAYPARLGLASFTMGGFAGGFEEPETIYVTNGASFTENYYLYRSTNPGVGYLDIVVK